MSALDWAYLIGLAILLGGCLALVIVAVRTAPQDPHIPEYTPEAPTLPPAIVVHLSVGDRVKDREPWEDRARAEKAGMN